MGRRDHNGVGGPARRLGRQPPPYLIPRHRPAAVERSAGSGLGDETSLTDILVQKLTSGNLNPNVLFELFSVYREWQEEMAKKISEKQEEIENKIETADALAVNILQRFNYSITSMRSSHNLAEVHPLQVEVGELKGRLTEVISNCDAWYKRIAAEGPENLR